LSLPLLAGAGWEREPTSYRDIPFGASEAEAESKIGAKSKRGFDCRDDPRPGQPEQRFCFSVTEIWGSAMAPIRVDEALIFMSGKLVAVEMSVNSERYTDTRALLVEMYGEPFKKERSTVTNSRGAMFQDERLQWKGKRMMLQFDRYRHGNLRRSEALLATIGYYDEKVKRRLE